MINLLEIGLFPEVLEMAPTFEMAAEIADNLGLRGIKLVDLAAKSVVEW